MKSILYLGILLITAFEGRAGCLTLLCPSPKTVSCTDTTWTFDTPGISNCPGCNGNDLSITVLNTTPLAGPACSQQTTRTWFITNDCGSGECSQTVTVVNTNQPVFAGATNITVTSCGAVQVFFNPTATETCCGSLPVTCSPPSGTYFPVGLATFVTCTVTDCCGSTYSTQFYIHVIQEQGLNVTCIDKSVPCGTNWTFDEPVVNDTCCSGSYSFFPQPPITNGTGCSQTISEVWGVTDECGNSNYCTQTVTILNSVVLYPTNVTISPGYPVPTNPPGFSSGCCSNVTLTPIGSVTNSSGSSQIIYQVWQAVDCCGNTYTCTNIVTLESDLPQVVCPSNKTITPTACSSGGTPPPGFAVLDNFPNFSGDGYNPSAPLLLASDGMLYGTAAGGGSGEGAVFRLNPDGTGYQLLKSFLGSDGGLPTAGLVEGSNGWLYGTTSAGYGDGTVFAMSKDGSVFTNVHYFGISTDGEEPRSGLVIGSDGALYGTTFGGGVNYGGTVFKIFQDGSGYATLYNFGSTVNDGSFAGPEAGLVIGSDEALYGTASQGGSNGIGMVFKVNQDGSGYTNLYSFSDIAGDGATPIAGLVFGSDGSLYGTTSAGGNSGSGTLFKINQDGSGYANLYSFGSVGEDGRYPAAGLIAGCDGALYGTTEKGGSNSLGTVFKVDLGGSNYLVLRSFSGGDGANPQAALVAGGNGALYGTTADGGTNGNGTVYEMSSGPGWTFDPPTLIDGGCGSNVTITILSTVQSNSACGQALTRTWQIIDCCGNSNVCSQTVFVGATNLPVLSCANDKTVRGGTAWSFDPPLASEASCSNLTFALFSSNLISASSCQNLYSGVWQVTDCCGNSLLCTQLVTVLASPPASAAAPVIIMASSPCGVGTNYINLFELCGTGLYWTEGQGVCGGAFCSDSKLGFLAEPGSSPTYSVDDCAVQFSGVASDGAYVYYSSNGNLYRKPVGDSASNPPQSLATPIGLQAGALTLFKGLLFFSAVSPGSVPGGIFSMNPDGTDLQQVASVAGTALSQVVRLRGYSYQTTNTTADALFILLADGSLDRCDLSSGGLTLLASSVVDFDLRNELSALGVWATSLYIAEGTPLALSSNTAAGELWQINAATGQGSAIFIPTLPAPCCDQTALVTGVAVDSQNIYLTLQPVVCNPASTNGCRLGPPSLWRQANPAQSPLAGASGTTNGVVPYWENAPVPYWELLGVDANAGTNLRSDGTWLYFLADLNPSSNTQGSFVKRLRVSTPALQLPKLVSVTMTNTEPAGRLLIQANVAGLSGFTYQLLRSTDLINWVPVNTIVMSAAGTFTFMDLGPPAGQAFYKANWETSYPSRESVSTLQPGKVSFVPQSPPCMTGDRGEDPYQTRGPLYQARMAVEVITTANPSSEVYDDEQQGYQAFAAADPVRVSMVVYDSTMHTTITETNTCQIGDQVNGGPSLGNPLFFTFEAGGGQPDNVYSTNMYDPDSPELVGTPIQFLKPFDAPAGDTLDLITRLEVLNAGTVWTAGDQDAGVGAALKLLGDGFSAFGGIVSIVPGGQAIGPFISALGAVLTVTGDLAQPGQNGEIMGCTVTDSLVPGFGPNDPPTDNAAPLLRIPLSGESLWQQTSNGDAVVAFDLDWRNETQSPGLCQRPHTKLYFRISRVVAEGVAGQPPISHGCNIAGSEPELLDAFSIDMNSVVVHDQYSNMEWLPGESISYQTPCANCTPHNLFPANGHITAISRIPGHVDIFAIDVDGNLDWNWRDETLDNDQWHSWTTVGVASFPPGAPIAVVSLSPTIMDLFAVDTSGTILTKIWSQTAGWTIGAFPISPAGAAIPYDGSNGGGITAVARDSDNLDVFVIGSGNNMFTASWAAGGVSGWSFALVPIATQGGQPGSQMASLSLTTNRMDVFFLDSQGHVQDAIWADGWSGQSEQVTATAALPQAGLAAVARKVNLTGCDLVDNSHMDVFTVAADGHILRNSWIFLENDNSWVPDENVELNAMASPTGQVGAISPWPGSIHVAATKADGTLTETWFRDVEEDPNGNNWQQTP